MGTAIQLASLVIAFVVCVGLFMYVVVQVTNFTSDETEAVAKGSVTRRKWRKQFAFRIGGSALAFFGLLVVLLYGFQKFGGRFGDEVRQARYEACLERTTAEVCEIHWVHLPKPQGEDGPTIVITPEGRIGTGLGL